MHFFVLVRGSRPGKTVQLTESEIRGLCLKSREIFLSQPILLELEAPLKICGKHCGIKVFYLLNLCMYVAFIKTKLVFVLRFLYWGYYRFYLLTVFHNNGLEPQCVATTVWSHSVWECKWDSLFKMILTLTIIYLS